MKFRDQLAISVTCPTCGHTDTYACHIDAPDGVSEELIEQAVEALAWRTASQLNLTQLLADRLQAKVRTRGFHVGGRVETTVVCLPAQWVEGRGS